MDGLKEVGIYALLLIPGFIWVQVYEHHLLREKKEQFVKTLEIVLWSAFIWAFSVWLPFGSSKLILNSLKTTLQGKNGVANLSKEPTDVIGFFAAVCIWTFLIANLWALCRKTRWGNALIKVWTGRDWYPSVAFRFFKENLDKGVTVVTSNKRYTGVLYSAPDTAEDKYIILTSVWVLPEPNPDKLMPEQLKLVKHLLIKIDEISEMRATDYGLVQVNPWVEFWNRLKSRRPTTPSEG